MNSQLVFPKFDDYPTVTAEEVREFEARHQLSLPEDYADFLVRHRGSLPMFQNERGEHMCAEFNVDWGDKPARMSGPIVHMECTFSLFEGKNIKSAFESEHVAQVDAASAFPYLKRQMGFSPVSFHAVLQGDPEWTHYIM